MIKKNSLEYTESPDVGCSQVVYETAELFERLVLDYNDKRIR